MIIIIICNITNINIWLYIILYHIILYNIYKLTVKCNQNVVVSTSNNK